MRLCNKKCTVQSISGAVGDMVVQEKITLAKTCKTKSTQWTQWMAAFGVGLLTMQSGMMGTWSSPYVAQLTSPDSQLPITEEEASWVASLLNLGRVVGAVLGATIAPFIGIKMSILVTCFPVMIGWVFFCIADSVLWLYLARFCGGITMGMLFAVYPIYLGEISDPSIRGALVTLGMYGLALGNLLICAIGPYMSIWSSSYVGLAPSFVLIPLYTFLPESPHFLVRNERPKAARKAMVFYNRGCNADEELQKVAEFVKKSDKPSVRAIVDELKTSHMKRAVTLVVLLNVSVQLSGLGNVILYMETILRDAQVVLIQPSIVVIIAMTFSSMCCCVSIFIIDKFGRKVILVFSVALTAILMGLLSTTFLLLDSGFHASDFQCLPIIGTIGIVSVHFSGMLLVPGIILGELFPPNIKYIVSTLSNVTLGTFAFVVSKSYQPLVNVIGNEYVFMAHGAIAIITIPFILVYMPETKGKSLQQIQIDLIRK